MTYEDLNLDKGLFPISSPIKKHLMTSDNFLRGSITTGYVRFMSADRLTAGTVTVSMNLGSATAGTVILDGVNNRIVVHDGTTNRIVIGEV